MRFNLPNLFFPLHLTKLEIIIKILIVIIVVGVDVVIFTDGFMEKRLQLFLFAWFLDSLIKLLPQLKERGRKRFGSLVSCLVFS